MLRGGRFAMEGPAVARRYPRPPSSSDISHSGTSLGTPTDAALPDCGHQTKGEGDLHMGASLPGTENSMTPDPEQDAALFY